MLNTRQQSEEVACVILASGFSRRFGTDKLMYPLRQGSENNQVLIQETLDNYTRVSNNVVVVLRSDNVDLKQQLADAKVTIVWNSEARQGMSQSIVSAVSNIKPKTGWLIGLADMPFVSPQTISRILNAAQSDSIVLPVHAGKVGHPVFFGRDFEQQLLALSGDVGAKEIIDTNPTKLIYIDCDDAGIHQDIDVINDLV